LLESRSASRPPHSCVVVVREKPPNGCSGPVLAQLDDLEAGGGPQSGSSREEAGSEDEDDVRTGGTLAEAGEAGSGGRTLSEFQLRCRGVWKRVEQALYGCVWALVKCLGPV